VSSLPTTDAGRGRSAPEFVSLHADRPTGASGAHPLRARAEASLAAAGAQRP